MKITLLFFLISLCSFAQNKDVFVIVDETPQYVGGASAYGNFLKNNLIYPPLAFSNGIEGKCYLKFVINSDSTISDIEVLKGVPGCSDCDKEAVRLIK